METDFKKEATCPYCSSIMRCVFGTSYTCDKCWNNGKSTTIDMDISRGCIMVHSENRIAFEELFKNHNQ